ncbi:pyridoxamine 5'-phosphate oxidase family protein [Amnibacterium endophyticum]|uniref:Pyridoxamine 5'-phosphate oxidase family protein n=1 Tax=Amnibacterium endophyticum TaxID=2109337 RepID=A0ABW4LED3_9MICO
MSDSNTTEDRKHVADLVKDAKVAMLTTMTEDGKHLSRPMALQDVEFDGDLWFFAYDDSAKVAQLRAEPSVNVSFVDDKGHSWTSVAGRAEVVHDRAKAEELWTPVLKAWFPDELETPGLALIKVHADSAEYWEGPTSTVALAAKNLRAAATGNPRNDGIANDSVEL